MLSKGWLELKISPSHTEAVQESSVLYCTSRAFHAHVHTDCFHRDVHIEEDRKSYDHSLVHHVPEGGGGKGGKRRGGGWEDWRGGGPEGRMGGEEKGRGGGGEEEGRMGGEEKGRGGGGEDGRGGGGEDGIGGSTDSC